MKIPFITLFLFIYSINYSQSVIVNYTEKRIISKEKLERIPEFARSNELATHNYTLEYSNGISYYRNNSEEKNVDSTERIDSQDKREEKSYRITDRHVEKWYYADFNRDELLFNFYNGKDHLLKWDWEITNEFFSGSDFSKTSLSNAQFPIPQSGISTPEGRCLYT